MPYKLKISHSIGLQISQELMRLLLIVALTCVRGTRSDPALKNGTI